MHQIRFRYELNLFDLKMVEYCKLMQSYQPPAKFCFKSYSNRLLIYFFNPKLLLKSIEILATIQNPCPILIPNLISRPLINRHLDDLFWSFNQNRLILYQKRSIYIKKDRLYIEIWSKSQLSIQISCWISNRTEIDDRNWPAWNPNRRRFNL